MNTNEMNIKMLPLSNIKPYEKNPRRNDEAVKYVAESIKEFGFKVPIVIDKDNVIVAGHTRYKAAKKLKIDSVPCIIANDLTDEQIKAFRLADNKVSEKAEWDFDLLANELDDLFDIDMTLFGFEDDIDDAESTGNNTESVTLSEEFIVPPFSVFDTRQGYWQDRKNKWKSLGLCSELGRKENLMNAPDLPDYATYGGTLKGVAPQTSIFDPVLTEVSYRWFNVEQTSIFDPVLTEVSYRWFNVEQGSIFDPFAGGSVRGIVAAKLGYNYTGIDLRSEQVEANYENAKTMGVEPKWICDDSLNADAHIENESVDMVFSCPPYADLEVYSDDPRDISNMDYKGFMDVYRRIISKAVNKLKNDRFAVFVVGDVRDKKGFYYDFISDTKKAFIDCGCKLYNEIILIEQIGTGAMRANRTFTSGRKVIKVHQNVLVFYKGDPKKIKENYPRLEIDMDLFDEG